MQVRFLFLDTINLARLHTLVSGPPILSCFTISYTNLKKKNSIDFVVLVVLPKHTIFVFFRFSFFVIINLSQGYCLAGLSPNFTRAFFYPTIFTMAMGMRDSDRFFRVSSYRIPKKKLCL